MTHELSGPEGQPKTKIVFKPPVQRLQGVWKRRGLFYEWPMLQYVYDNYRDLGGIWIDGGSNIGNHTVYFAKYCKLDYVISVEAILSYMNHQTENLELNGLSNRVRQFNVAISDSVGTGEMIKCAPNLIPGAKWSWHSGMYKLDESKPGKTPVTTLDTILNENGITGITLVKLDIEGGEFKALRGAIEMIARDHPVLFLETTSRQEQRAYDGLLADFGYKPGVKIYPKIFEFVAE